jgi:hypothetical protein
MRILAGTLFESTKLSLRTWFRVIWEVVSRKNGVSALAVSNTFKIRYDTVWYILQKLRRAMVRPGRELLSGTVEVDETYYGGFSEG